MVTGALANVDPETPADEAALLKFVDGTGAAPDAKDADAELGRASALTMLLVLLPVDLSRGRLLIPMSDLARIQVTRGELQKPETGPALDELIRYRVGRAREIIEEGRSALPAHTAGHLRHLLV